MKAIIKLDVPEYQIGQEVSIYFKDTMMIEGVVQEPKTGHWEWVQYDYNPKLGNWHCSECRCVVVECVNKNEKGCIPIYKYCPQCGAKMVEPQESEDEWVSEISETEIKAMTKEQNYMRGYKDGKSDILDKIRAEIERQEKWLLRAGYNAYNVDIAFSSIKSVLAESEDKE